MKKSLFINLEWDKLCYLLTKLFANEKDHILLPSTRGNIYMFHSNNDGSPNYKEIKKFFKLKNTGKADYFLCCDANNIPNHIRKYHILKNFFGEIHTIPEESYEVYPNRIKLVLGDENELN